MEPIIEPTKAPAIQAPQKTPGEPGEVEEFLGKITPRKYQTEIYNTCKDKNCLVVLPTGIGKTLIGLMLAINRQKAFPASKILFLAPTRPLAQQHLDYFKKHLPELFGQLELFTGKIDAKRRQELWQTADIVFSTPQCISNDLKNSLYDLSEVSLLIEDECHHCLKNYSYVHVVESYRKSAKNQRILGLTASPGADKKTISQIAKNLGIEAIELRTRESQDVKEYIHELNFEAVRLDFPPKFREISELLKKIFYQRVAELKSRKLLFGPATKTALLETQRNIMGRLASGRKNFVLFAGASICAQAVKIQHALELLETQTLSALFDYIQNLFEQARLEKSKAVQKLVKLPEFSMAYIKLAELMALKKEHPKILELKNIVQSEIKTNPKAKIMVFGQYRATVTRICKELNQIPGIAAKVFIGQAKKESKFINGERESMGLSQNEQKEIIEQFKLGKINVLCATSIGEEGLDIPEVNAVIFYEPIPSAIRKIQRAGRTARLMKGKLIILITRDTRDESYYYAAIHKEKKMHEAIKNIQEGMQKTRGDAEKKGEEKESSKAVQAQEGANQKTLV